MPTTAPAPDLSGLDSLFPGLVERLPEFRGEAALRVRDSARIAEMMAALKARGFLVLSDICAVDHSPSEPRFELVYHLYAPSARRYLRVKAPAAGPSPKLPTVSHLWPGADWHEREAFDMMGIRFAGHPDLRRILMWDGYPHHPLRKDFPLAGIPTEDGRADAAPLEGGPFVAEPGPGAAEREPRSREI